MYVLEQPGASTAIMLVKFDPFAKFRAMYPNPWCVTHTDLDGYASAAIMVKMLTTVFGYSLEDITVKHVSPATQILYEDYETHGFTIITDLSLINGDNFENFRYALENPELVVIYIDHHQSTIDHIKQNIGEEIQMSGVLNTEYCATALAWEYYTMMMDMKTLMNNKLNLCFDSIPVSKINFKYDSLNIRLNSMFLAMVNDSDLFTNRIQNSRKLNTAFFEDNRFSKDVKSSFWQETIIGNISKDGDKPELTALIENMCKRANILQHFKNYFYSKELIKSGFYGSFTRFPDYQFLFVNRADCNPGDALGEFYKNASGIVNYIVNSRGAKFTIYWSDRTNEDPVNSKIIATAYGGGGHPGAAGFTIPFAYFKFADIVIPNDDIELETEWRRNVIPIVKSEQLSVNTTLNLCEEGYKTMVIYTDGSFNSNKTDECAGYAAVFLVNESIDNYFVDIFYGVVTDNDMVAMRNVGGEVKAATKAIEISQELRYSDIDIYHDYQGVSEWATGSWKANKKSTKDYKNLCMSVKDTLNIRFHHVRGHSGNPLNDIADIYAAKAIDEYLTDPMHRDFSICNVQVPKKG